jgi:hypothetical protein
LNTLISGIVPIRQCKTTAVKSEVDQFGKSEKARIRDINETVTPVILR